MSTSVNCLWKSPLAFKERLFNTIYWIQTCKLWCIFSNIFHSFLMCEMCVENWFSFHKFSILQNSFVWVHKYFMSLQVVYVHISFDKLVQIYKGCWCWCKSFLSPQTFSVRKMTYCWREDYCLFQWDLMSYHFTFKY